MFHDIERKRYVSYVCRLRGVYNFGQKKNRADEIHESRETRWTRVERVFQVSREACISPFTLLFRSLMCLRYDAMFDPLHMLFLAPLHCANDQSFKQQGHAVTSQRVISDHFLFYFTLPLFCDYQRKCSSHSCCVILPVVCLQCQFLAQFC